MPAESDGHRAESRPGGQLMPIESGDTSQASDVGQKTVSLDNRTPPPSPGSNQDGQQLGVRKCSGPELEQPFPRPLRRLHLANALCHWILHKISRGRDLRIPQAMLAFIDNHSYNRLRISNMLIIPERALARVRFLMGGI